MTRGAAAIVAASLAACAAFGEGKADEASPDSGNIEAADDGGATSDGGDGAPPAALCPPSALLCEHFDDGLGAWQGASSAFRIEPVQGNKVLMVRVPIGTGDDTISRDLPGVLTGVRVSFLFRVANPGFPGIDGKANYAIVRVEKRGSGGKMFSALYLSGGGASSHTQLTVDTPSGLVGTALRSTSYGEWHRCVIEVRLGAPGSIGYGVDGETLATAPMQSDLSLELAISLGVYRPNNQTPAISLDLDEVMVESL